MPRNMFGMNEFLAADRCKEVEQAIGVGCRDDQSPPTRFGQSMHGRKEAARSLRVLYDLAGNHQVGRLDMEILHLLFGRSVDRVSLETLVSRPSDSLGVNVDSDDRRRNLCKAYVKPIPLLTLLSRSG
jgi:hypothetical protein